MSLNSLKKFFSTPLRQRLSTISVTQSKLKTWVTGWNFFFILGFGRSGTAFMADLLNQDQHAHVFHEPVLEDFFAHLLAHYSPEMGKRYMTGFRKKEIYSRMWIFSPSVYGEVNGVLRCHAEAIKIAFPSAYLIHLVRDGRDVVRSSMPRRIMTIRNPLSLMIHPSKADPWYSHWADMDRFARICWYWQEENRRLREAVGKTVQFEKILSDYDYFHDKVLEPCHIQISRKTWEIAVTTPRNTTKEFSMPKWEYWTLEQQKTFRQICGDEMEKCGYTL